ncbi:MAG: hypothetical protein ACLRMJ_09975 [Alistipes finegoldii]
MTKLSDRVYVDSVYVKNGRFSVYYRRRYYLDSAGNLSAAETDLTVDVARLRIVTLNLNEKTYSIERITTPTLLPDSEVAKYATRPTRPTAAPRSGCARLDWNSGENIGGISSAAAWSPMRTTSWLYVEPQQLRPVRERLRRSRAAARRRRSGDVRQIAASMLTEFLTAPEGRR